MSQASAGETGNDGAERRSRRRREVLSAGMLIIVLGWYVQFWVLFGRSSISDATADWLVTRAALDGNARDNDVLALSSRYGVTFGWPDKEIANDSSRVWREPSSYSEWHHPRTPGTLILMSPLVLMPGSYAYAAILLASAVLAIVLAWSVLPRISKIDRSKVLLFAPLALVSAPVFGAFEYGTQSLALALLIGLAWLWSRERDSIPAGAALAVAITLKVWPAIILLPFLLKKRWRTLTTALAVGAALNALGMVVFDIRLTDMIALLKEAGDSFLMLRGNSSAVAWLETVGVGPLLGFGLLVTAGVVGTWWATRRAGLDTGFAFATTVALLISPLSWTHYGVVLIGVALWLLSRGGPGSWFAAGWMTAALFGLLSRWLPSTPAAGGLWTLMGRLLLVAGVGWCAWSRTSQKEVVERPLG